MSYLLKIFFSITNINKHIKYIFKRLVRHIPKLNENQMLHSDDFWWTADYVIRYNIKACKTQKKTHIII